MIYTISSGLDTVTKQLTDSTIREYVVDELLPERDYTIAVRGYYQLLGPASTTTVRLEGIAKICVTTASFMGTLRLNKSNSLACHPDTDSSSYHIASVHICKTFLPIVFWDSYQINHNNYILQTYFYSAYFSVALLQILK